MAVPMNEPRTVITTMMETGSMGPIATVEVVTAFPHLDDV